MVLTRSSVIPSMTRWVAKVQPTALGPRTVSASSRFIMRTVAQWRFPPATALPTRLNAHQVAFSYFQSCNLRLILIFHAAPDPNGCTIGHDCLPAHIPDGEQYAGCDASCLPHCPPEQRVCQTAKNDQGCPTDWECRDFLDPKGCPIPCDSIVSWLFACYT